MKDRLQYELITLKNGLKIYYIPNNCGYFKMTHVIPFGYLHNQGDIKYGSFHFLEHMVFGGNKIHTEPNELDLIVTKNGGFINAWTGSAHTKFELTLPTENDYSQIIESFFSMIYSPLLTGSQLVKEQQIIINERLREKTYSPFNDEVDQYLFTKWIDTGEDKYMNKSFVVGNNDVIESYTPEYIKSLHSMTYHTNKAHLVLTGEVDINFVVSILQNIHTNDINLDKAVLEAKWVKPQYHEINLGDSSRYLYTIGSIFELNFENIFKLDILKRVLTYNEIGVLIKWLRKEKAMVYNLYIDTHRKENKLIYSLTIPTSNKKDVEYIRNNIKEKILQGISDENIVRQLKDLTKKSRVFNLQTSDIVHQSIEYMIRTYGRVYTETDLSELIEQVSAQDLKKYIDNFYGEILICPK